MRAPLPRRPSASGVPRVRRVPRPLAFTAIVIGLTPALSIAQQSYHLVDVTAGSPYDQTSANGINGAGHITGYGVMPGTGEIHAFIDRDGTFQDLGLLGYSASDGISIDNSDQLAVDGIGPGSTALFSSNGQTRRIGSIDGGTTSAYAMNNLGDIVGSGKDGDGNTVGFSWVGGVFHDLSTLGAWRATNINDSGQIVGSSIYSWGYGGYIHTSSHAFLYSGGVFKDLGSLTGDPRTNTEAFGINGAGQIVGYSTGSDHLCHAFLYAAGSMQDLGTIGAYNATAIAINNNGVVIGNITNPYNANLGAFVYANGRLTDLSDLITSGGDGWSQLIVAGINDGGSIVGSGTLDGATHGFVAVPNAIVGAGVAPAPLRSTISGVRPNPFVSTTEIAFALSTRDATAGFRLEIFDVAGRRVATLPSQGLAPGPHTVRWNGRADGGARVPAGVYVARLTTPDGATSRKLVLVK